MPARFKIDENLPHEIADPLNSRGYDAVTVADQGWSGLLDDVLWQRVQTEARWFITADKQFGDIRLYPPGTHAGVVLLRPGHEGLEEYVRLTTTTVDRVDFDNAAGAVVVVTERGVRIRGAP